MRGRHTRLLVILLCAMWLQGCGNAGSDSQVFTYHLLPASSPTAADGSRIAVRCSSLGTPAALAEPLSGTFTLGPAEHQSGEVSNFSITNISFTSASHTVSGESGLLSLAMNNAQQPLSMVLAVAVDGQQVEVMGGGSLATFSGSPPTLTNVPLSGAGAPCGSDGVLEYDLTIFAVPDV